MELLDCCAYCGRADIGSTGDFFGESHGNCTHIVHSYAYMCNSKVKARFPYRVLRIGCLGRKPRRKSSPMLPLVMKRIKYLVSLQWADEPLLATIPAQISMMGAHSTSSNMPIIWFGLALKGVITRWDDQCLHLTILVTRSHRFSISKRGVESADRMSTPDRRRQLENLN